MNLEKINNISFDELSINDDYPIIQIDKLTDEEINLIKNILNGIKSEMTSIGQYSYQHTLISNSSELTNVCSTIKKIAITEMKHLEILNKILLLSNVDPKFCIFIDSNPNICNFWNASYINYSTDFEEIINKDIDLENAAIREYTKLVKISKNENLIKIIERILKDEYSHIKYFNLLLDNIK